MSTHGRWICQVCSGARLRIYVEIFGYALMCRDCGWHRAISNAEAETWPKAES